MNTCILKLTFSIFLFLSSNTFYGQTNEEWLEMGKGCRALHCRKEGEIDSQHYRRTFKFKKFVDKNPDLFAAQVLTVYYNYDKYLKSHVKDLAFYIKLVMDNKLYQNELSLNYTNEMDDKQFSIEYGKFCYLIQVKYCMTRYMKQSKNKLPDNVFFTQYRDMTDQIEEWGRLVKNSKFKNEFCLDYDFFAMIRRSIEEDREIQKSILEDKSESEFDALISLLKVKEYNIHVGSKNYLEVDVTFMNIQDVKFLISLILNNLQSYVDIAKSQIAKEKSKTLTFGDSYRNLPGIRIFTNEEVPVLRYNSNNDINLDTFKTKLNQEKLFSIMIGFPTISGRSHDIRLVYYYKDCNDIKLLPKEFGTLNFGNTIIKQYDKFIFELECLGVNVSDLEQTSLYIANAFDIQSNSFEKLIKERNASKDVRPFTRGNKFLAYPYIMGEVTSTRNLDQEKEDAFREFLRSSLGNTGSSNSSGSSSGSYEIISGKPRVVRRDNDGLAAASIKIYDGGSILLASSDVCEKTYSVTYTTKLGERIIKKDPFQDDEDFSRVDFPVTVEVSYQSSDCAGKKYYDKVVINSGGFYDIHLNF